METKQENTEEASAASEVLFGKILNNLHGLSFPEQIDYLQEVRKSIQMVIESIGDTGATEELRKTLGKIDEEVDAVTQEIEKERGTAKSDQPQIGIQ